MKNKVLYRKHVHYYYYYYDVATLLAHTSDTNLMEVGQHRGVPVGHHKGVLSKNRSTLPPPADQTQEYNITSGTNLMELGQHRGVLLENRSTLPPKDDRKQDYNINNYTTTIYNGI